MQDFGGDWTELKLGAFVDYVNSYLTIMNAQRDKWGCHSIYFDGFAGSGDATIKANHSDPEAALQYYEGSARRVLSIDDRDKFDEYFFVEADPAKAKSLQAFAETIPELRPGQVQVKCGDCNAELAKLVAHMKRNQKMRALVFLDPFGMNLDWDSLAQLKQVNYRNGGTDLWLLVPTGIGVNRLLPKDGKIQHPDRLEKFFGLPIDKIQDIFYRKESEILAEQGQFSLFDDILSDEERSAYGLEDRVQKINQPVEKAMDVYREQLKTIWTHVTHEPLILKNSRHSAMFHFVFASNNETAFKIAKYIIAQRQSKRR